MISFTMSHRVWLIVKAACTASLLPTENSVIYIERDAQDLMQTRLCECNSVQKGGKKIPLGRKSDFCFSFQSLEADGCDLSGNNVPGPCQLPSV